MLQKKLAEHGAKVFLLARRENELQAQVEALEAIGAEAGYAVCDVSDEAQCKTAIDACINKFGQLDIMVLAAGISGKTVPEGSFDFDSADWEHVLGINLYGQYYMYTATNILQRADMAPLCRFPPWPH